MMKALRETVASRPALLQLWIAQLRLLPAGEYAGNFFARAGV
jgi:hypothetical protein